MVAVWDIRSRKPMKVFTTDRSRLPAGRTGRIGSRLMGAASRWLYEDTWHWTMPAYRAPGWGVQHVKFSSGVDGKELMTFTEVRHPGFSLLRGFDLLTFSSECSLLHVIDTTMFDTKRSYTYHHPPHHAPQSQLHQAQHPPTQPQSHEITPIAAAIRMHPRRAEGM